MAPQLTRVLVQLRDSILKGEFSPGERLAEIPLAEKLGASRSPVRTPYQRYSARQTRIRLTPSCPTV